MNNDSFQLHSTQFTPLKNIRSRILVAREDTLNLSSILNETSISRHLNDTSLRQILDDSATIVNAGNAGGGLSESFFKIIQSSRPSDVLHTLQRLAHVCYESLELVEPWNRYNAHNYWLAEEANTWKLLYSLYADTLLDHPESLDSLITEVTLSQQTLVDALYKTDSGLRLMLVLVNWLETTAAYQEEATKTSATVVGNDIHWGNTLHELLIGNSLFNKEKNTAMVTCLDPDAPRRQKKAIHSDDQKDDNDLCKRIFTEVRCGNFEQAVSLCINAGQAWRGAALQGWRLLHYLPRENSNSPVEIAGNPSRDLWKWCALGIANNVTENMHYRATVAILCGSLASAIPICQGNWEDLLWAHLRVQIVARVDKFLNEHHATAEANTTTTEVMDLLQKELHVEEMSLQQIFSAIKALMNGKRESNYQICQRYLMLGSVRAIMQDSLNWLENGDERFVRFLAHLVLVLRLMGKDPHHDIGDTVLEKYVTQLVNTLITGSEESPELIAYYTSTLPNDRQIHLYAEFMDKIYKRNLREGVVKAGINAGLDVAASARLAILKSIAGIQEGFGDIEMSINQTAFEKDKPLIDNVISSLEWLSLIENQQIEALWLCNAMVRKFIFLGNTDAASSCIVNLEKMFSNIVNDRITCSSELREYLCLKTYLEGLECFATWYRQYISGMPKDVEPLSADATFSDKVHHEQRTAVVKQQKAQWKNTVYYQARHAKKILYDVLLFPGGWLQDQNDGTSSQNFTEEDKQDREKQLETLRKLCIPEVTILILKILQSDDDINNHKEAVKLSDLIAGENRCLYKVFTKSKLLEILDRIKESSLVLVEKGRDMFGYELDE